MVLKKFKFNYQGKKFDLEVKECKSLFSQFLGLMFRKKSPLLLFIFSRLNRQAIHSFFCKPFIAIWFNGKKVIEVKRVKYWRLGIKPKENFDKLLEIPINNRHYYDFLGK